MASRSNITCTLHHFLPLNLSLLSVGSLFLLPPLTLTCVFFNNFTLSPLHYSCPLHVELSLRLDSLADGHFFPRVLHWHLYICRETGAFTTVLSWDPLGTLFMTRRFVKGTQSCKLSKTFSNCRRLLMFPHIVIQNLHSAALAASQHCIIIWGLLERRNHLKQVTMCRGELLLEWGLIDNGLWNVVHVVPYSIPLCEYLVHSDAQ